MRRAMVRAPVRVARRSRWLGCVLVLGGCTPEEDMGSDGARTTTDMPSPATSADGAVIDATTSDPSCTNGTTSSSGGPIVTNGHGNTINVDGNGHTVCEEIRGNGKLVDQTREVGSFTELLVTGRFAVELSRGPTAVRLHMDENLVQHVVTRVERGALYIESTPRQVSLAPSPEARIYVSAPSLEGIATSGAVSMKGAASGRALTLDASGSSDVVLALSVEQVLDADVTGAAKVVLSGSAGKLEASASGASVLASSVTNADADVMATGASQVTVYAPKRVEASASGSAKVKVSGAPPQRTTEATGAGMVTFQD